MGKNQNHNITAHSRGKSSSGKMLRAGSQCASTANLSMKDLTTIPQEEIDGTFSPEVPHGDFNPPYQNNTNMIDAEGNYNDMRHRASDIMDPICELS